jgi:hypothetical protein
MIDNRRADQRTTRTLPVSGIAASRRVAAAAIVLTLAALPVGAVYNANITGTPTNVMTYESAYIQ